MTKSQDKSASKEKSTTVKKTGKKQNRRPRGNRGGANRTKAPKKTKTFPTMQESIEIDHAVVRGAFDQHFDGFRSAFFHTTSILGRFGMEEGANQVHQYIIDLIDSARVEVENATGELAKLIKTKSGIESVPRTTSDPARRTAEVPAFVVRKYLSLFPTVDRLIDAIVCAENVGAIGWARRSDLLKKAPHYLRSPAGRFHSLSTKLGARQKANEAGMAEAKKAMEEVLSAVLEQHQELKGIEEKRPMSTAKTGTEG